jgi:hypothetical protein
MYLLVYGRSIKVIRMREVLFDLSQDTKRVKKNDGIVSKHGISRKIAGREMNLKKTP